MLFPLTANSWSTSLFLFSNSSSSTSCFSKSSKHSSGTFGLCQRDFNSFKSSLHEAIFVFFAEILHWNFSKTQTTCIFSNSFFTSAVVVLLSFGKFPLMTSTSILKKLKLSYAGARDFQVTSLEQRITTIICLHCIKFFFQT